MADTGVMGLGSMVGFTDWDEDNGDTIPAGAHPLLGGAVAEGPAEGVSLDEEWSVLNAPTFPPT
jgi:hypothetical protein